MRRAIMGLWVGLVRRLWCTGPSEVDITLNEAMPHVWRGIFWLYVNRCGCAWCRRQPIYGSPPPRDA